MTLDETIKHAYEHSKRSECTEYQKEFLKLISWLEELKLQREFNRNIRAAFLKLNNDYEQLEKESFLLPMEKLIMSFIFGFMGGLLVKIFF